MLRALDSKIIEKLTKFSHWFQKLTGLTCYFFAKMGIFLAIFGTFVRVINYFLPFLTVKSNMFDIAILIFSVLIFGPSIQKCNKAEENLFSSEVVKLERNNFWFRIYCLSWVVFEIIFLPLYIYETRYLILEVVARVGFFIGLSIYNYFVVVVPLPPGKSKVRKWVEGLFAPQPRLEPIPVKRDC
ncbi:MAG: hypothetical protein HYT61_03775 [Candidatus Yanofskybacteria bacterium]|nr:hypothetical protein [Candidatus Yanofskybacteria bacterium]